MISERTASLAHCIQSNNSWHACIRSISATNAHRWDDDNRPDRRPDRDGRGIAHATERNATCTGGTHLRAG
jgi:hypothetical protein